MFRIFFNSASYELASRESEFLGSEHTMRSPKATRAGPGLELLGPIPDDQERIKNDRAERGIINTARQSARDTARHDPA
jgi:hypothetical protein